MKQLCEDLRRFAIEVHQLGFSLNGGIGEPECLDLSQRMLAAARHAEEQVKSDQLSSEGEIGPMVNGVHQPPPARITLAVQPP